MICGEAVRKEERRIRPPLLTKTLPLRTTSMRLALHRCRGSIRAEGNRPGPPRPQMP